MRSRTRVLYLLYGDILDNVYGSQLEPLWRHVSNSGVDLTVLAMMAPRIWLNPGLRNRLRERVQSSPVRVKTTYLGAGAQPRWPRLLLRQLANVIEKERPHVLHARGPIAAGLAAMLLAERKKEGAPRLIFDVRGDTIAELREGGLLGSDRNTDRYVDRVREFERAACAVADDLFCVSGRLSEVVAKRYRIRGKVSIVPCWAEPLEFQKVGSNERDRIRQDLGVKPKNFLWCYIGSGAKWQALSETISLASELFQENQQHRFLFVTNDPEKVHRACEAQALPATTFTVRSGSRTQTLRWLTAGDAGILLREKNDINRVACPMKLADYLFSRLPVLISDCIGDVSEWVRVADAGVVTNLLEPRHLQAAAKTLFQRTQQEGEAISERAGELFERQFSLKRYLSTYLTIYG